MRYDRTPRRAPVSRFKPIPDEEGTEMTKSESHGRRIGPKLQTDPR